MERKTTTDQIKSLEREIGKLLTLQLDKLMEFPREDNPEFFSLYKNARMIVHLKLKSGKGEDLAGMLGNFY